MIQPIRYAVRFFLSSAEGIPLKAIALPGANAAGDLSHLSKLAADHLRVAFEDKAEE